MKSLLVLLIVTVLASFPIRLHSEAFEIEMGDQIYSLRGNICGKKESIKIYFKIGLGTQGDGKLVKTIKSRKELEQFLQNLGEEAVISTGSFWSDCFEKDEESGQERYFWTLEDGRFYVAEIQKYFPGGVITLSAT